jgi:RNA recognition motif-containing protein
MQILKLLFFFVILRRFRYGRIEDIDIKTPARPPAFAFVTYEDSRDADDAIRSRDGYNYDGFRIRCEIAKGKSFQWFLLLFFISVLQL